MEENSMTDISIIIPMPPGDEEPECLDYIDSHLDYEIIIKRGKNVSRNRNRGIRSSGSEKLVFLDDDAKPCEDFLEICYRYLDEYSIITGKIVHSREGLIKRASKAQYDQEIVSSPWIKL